MTACWVALVAAAFVLGVALTTAALAHRRHRSPFAPLPDLPDRPISRWPPVPVRVLPEHEPVLYDAEERGWWAP